MCQLSEIGDWGRSKGAGSSEQGRQGSREGRGAEEKRSYSKFSPLCPSASFQCPMPNAQFDSFHRTPLELGIKPARRGSISTASRVALAKALNVASMM